MSLRDRFTPPSERDATHFNAAINQLELFRAISPTIPLSYVSAFLSVALKPGEGSTYYARQLGILPPVMSRLLLEIGKKTRSGGPGLGLLDSSQSPTDLRHVNYYLTAKGEKLLAKWLSLSSGGKA